MHEKCASNRFVVYTRCVFLIFSHVKQCIWLSYSNKHSIIHQHLYENVIFFSRKNGIFSLHRKTEMIQSETRITKSFATFVTRLFDDNNESITENHSCILRLQLLLYPILYTSDSVSGVDIQRIVSFSCDVKIVIQFRRLSLYQFQAIQHKSN